MRMISKNEFLPMWEQLYLSFPRTPVTDQNAGAYYDALNDLDSWRLDTAIHELIRESDFFPSIAEIRRRASEVKRPGAITDHSFVAGSDKNLCGFCGKRREEHE